MNESIAYIPATMPQEYGGHLQQIWNYQQIRYQRMWSLYTGETWDEIDTTKKDETGASAKKYRVGVNDVSLACMMHAQLLFGDVRDSGDPLLRFRVEKRRGQDETSESDIQRAQEFLDELWGDSQSREEQFSGALISQVTGGIFWRVRFATGQRTPFDLYPFRFETVRPDFVFPVFSPGSSEFSEVFVRYKLPRAAAKNQWNVWSRDWPDMVEYREHWTPNYLVIRVGNEGSWENIESIANPFGFVPFVYIPHVLGDTFFGIPLAEMAGADTLSTEYNQKISSVGDLVTQNSYPFGILKNHITGRLGQPFRLFKNGPIIINLGSASSPDLPSPELDWYNPAEVTVGYSEYLSGLEKKLRLSMAIPPVAMGEDEGSQRSSLTLMARMFPMTSHVKTERWLWSPKTEMLNRMAIRMAQIKRITGVPQTLDVKKVRCVPTWAPMMSRDRTELVAEMTQRQAAGHTTPRIALEQYEDVPEAEMDAVLEDIKEHMEWQAEITQPQMDGVPAQSVSDNGKR